MKSVVSTVFNCEQMKSGLHVSRHEILSLPMLEYAAKALCCAGIDFCVLEEIISLPEEESYIVLAGNAPLVQSSTITRLILFHNENNNDISVCANGDQITSAIFAVNGKYIKEALQALSEDRILFGGGYKSGVMKIENAAETLRVWDRVQLAAAYNVLRARTNDFHMRNGVTIIDPARTDIGADVIIGRETTIYPGCFLESETIIGENCIIGPDCRISKSNIADFAKISYSNIFESSIGKATVVGPYAFVRPNSVIGCECRIGDFVEIKNSVIGDRTKASHLTYIGDSDVGKNVNFGCGTVTVNYNGISKNRTTIQNDAFIGCNTNIVAPVNIGKNAYTAAGSTITQDVPPDCLAIARAYQTNKLDWVKDNR